MTFDEDPDPESPFGLGDLLSQVQQMQELLASAQAEASDQLVVGQAGDGAVMIGVTGGLEFRTVTIDPAAVDQGDASLLEDLVLVALRDAMTKVGELNLSAMANSGLDELTGFDEGPLGSLGLGGLFGDAVPAEGHAQPAGVSAAGGTADGDGAAGQGENEAQASSAGSTDSESTD